MKAQFTKPDFSNSIVNISATIAKFLGCPNDKPVLPELEKELEKGYKNIIFLILDGLGMHPIEKNLSPSSFLVSNIKQVLTSVFPSTTTNATTSFLTNKYPMEHGWFGWSLYFDELNRAVDIFLDADSFTGESVGKGFVKSVLPVEPYYKKATVDYKTSVVVPEYWDSDNNNKYVWHSLKEMLSCIEEICKSSGKQFIYAYCDEPDHTMHGYGVTSAEAKKVIKGLNDGLEKLNSKLDDTLFIICADHGQIDVDGTVEIYRDTELTSMLEWPQFLEARATAFKVKENCRSAFAELFNKKYGADFELFSTQYLIEENYFGGAVNEHARMLGDFIAVGKTNKIMKLTPLSHTFKGHHTSLTEEMQVPLIFVGNKREMRSKSTDLIGNN